MYEDDQTSNHPKFLSALRAGDISGVKAFALKVGYRDGEFVPEVVSRLGSITFRWAVEKDATAFVKDFIEEFPHQHIDFPSCLMMAAEKGRTEIVKIMRQIGHHSLTIASIELSRAYAEAGGTEDCAAVLKDWLVAIRDSLGSRGRARVEAILNPNPFLGARGCLRMKGVNVALDPAAVRNQSKRFAELGHRELFSELAMA